MKLAIAAIVKNEARYLDEWLLFHRLMGVNRFYIGVHPSSDDTLGILDRRSGWYKDIKTFCVPPPVLQCEFYNLLLPRLVADDIDWAAFIDADEFLFSPKYFRIGGLKEAINDVVSFEESAPGIVVHWVMYGTSYQKTYEARCVTERFQMRAANVNPHVKSIVRPECVVKFRDPHHVLYQGSISPVNERGEIVDRLSPTHQNGSVELLRINHYFTKSEEEFRIKHAKGRADGPARGPIESYLNDPNQNGNDVFDPVLATWSRLVQWT